MRYVSFSLCGVVTVTIAWPTCLTMMLLPVKDVFCAKCPSTATFFDLFSSLNAVIGGWCETCSAARSKRPEEGESKCPKNCSPRIGLSGFFSLPVVVSRRVYEPCEWISTRELCMCSQYAQTHLQRCDEPFQSPQHTLLWCLPFGNSSEFIAWLSPVCLRVTKDQRMSRLVSKCRGLQAENSTSETGERMNEGAVIELKSPVMLARLRR